MTSRRPRKTDFGIEDLDKLVEAVKQIKIHKKPTKTIARQYDIPAGSMLRYIKKFNEQVPDITARELKYVLSQIASVKSHTMVGNFSAISLYFILMFSLFFRYLSTKKNECLLIIFLSAAIIITASA